MTEGTAATLAPIANAERIQALDVIRGFALIGIFLMNVEWFNRPIADIDSGMPVGLQGWDLAAGWLIYVFVQGKFWTLFSLLFGMGFAVMLGRAERAGRDFVLPYVRRIAALALFGVCHFVFVWAGDILLSYAIGATALLLVFYGRPANLAFASLLCLATGIAFDLDGMVAGAATLVTVSVLATFLRSDVEVSVRGRDWHPLTLIAGPVSVAVLAAAMVQAQLGLAVVAVVIAIAGFFATRYRQPEWLRPLRAGAFLYLAPFLAMALIGALKLWQPALEHPRTTEQIADIAKERSDLAADNARETAIMRGDSYLAAVQYRAGKLPGSASEDTAFASLVIGMFLVGTWFVRSGIMANVSAHLPLFRRLAFVGLPIGLAMGLLGALVGTHFAVGEDVARNQLATGLALAGNLPACLGYASLVVLMLHSGTVLSRISVLAPAGRMALTNYLMQSLIQAAYFYGHGLGHWGMPRAQQVGFVAIVYVLQVAFSHWWLARFNYGPMEWLWRAATYWRWPAWRRLQ